MRKKLILTGMAVLTMLLVSACGGSASETAAGGSGGKGEVTWSWGTFRGLYGDAEVTFNEDGGRETVLMKYPNGSLYRQIEYAYDFNGAYIGGKQVYPTEKITKDAGGNELFTYWYNWAICEESVDHWGAGCASDVTPILEAAEQIAAGKVPETEENRFYTSYEYGYNMETEEGTGSVSYQELGHNMVSGQSMMDVYYYGSGYWLTQRVDGNPAKTWFYAPDGRLDEDLTIIWNYEKGKPVSLQLGQYETYTYMAEVSDAGRTVTYTLDSSHTAETDEGESKDLEQIYTFTLSWQEDGSPAEFCYRSSVDYLNTEAPEVTEYKITYHHENGVLTGAEYNTAEDGKQSRQYTITCNAQGMLETEDHLLLSVGGGDIGAKAYTYHENGMPESKSNYNDFTTEDASKILSVKHYDENGVLTGETFYEDGEVEREVSYTEES